MRKARLARKNMTQARLAERVGVTRETIYRLEGGRMATADVLGRVCDVLGIDRAKFKYDKPATDAFAHYPELTLLRDRRRKLGLRLDQCAVAAGVSVSTLSRFESGRESSRELARFDSGGRAVALISEGLAKILEFNDVEALDRYWRTGKEP
ncbi:helix-turn-helix transcriptional regulator [Sphingomonas sp. 3P27F8]|uniref:helix-turn-helix domain-containing protein n=1 Tax=Sphingomonas sp. 3P27F8 TaxID=2502213 RepID=UPI001484C83B|nr:helix-turn-helix transcriptional regulator [Sphingomonas sp. 3P27F8]